MSCLLMMSDMLGAWSLLAAWGKVWPYLLMLLGFSIIVFVHELGHFAVAKWADVRVEKFAIGFGKELFGFSRGETRYSFNMLPLGGYVKMLGQEDFDDKENELKFKEDPRSFVNKPVSRRMAIVSAGVIMNVLFACLVFGVCFMIGMEGDDTRIGLVDPGSPADKAGLLPGDRIKAVNGNAVREFNEVQMAIVLAGRHEELEFTVERGGAERQILVEPEQNDEKARLMAGIAPGLTREILAVGPELLNRGPDYPRIGDVLVEVGGVPITDDNIDRVYWLLAHNRADVVVEREDQARPDAPAQRVTVKMPPILRLQPAERGDPDSTHLLGLTPLVRFWDVDTKGRAGLHGLEAGDTVRMFDDVLYPTRGQIDQAVRDNAERDVSFEVVKASGRELKGFVRPKAAKGGGTIQCAFRALDTNEAGTPRAAVGAVRGDGPADQAGIKPGDMVIECGGVRHPTIGQINRALADSVNGRVSLKLQRGDETVGVAVRPQIVGGIQAIYPLVALDVMQVGRIVETLAGRPSPAKQAGIPMGATILAVNDQPIATWRDLIDRFREGAGTSVSLKYRDPSGAEKTAAFPVPHGLHTKLGLGPEGVIVSIDGKEHIRIKGADGDDTVSANYPLGTAAALKELVGATQVPVVYRENLLAEAKTAYVDVTEEMVDPWVARVTLAPNVSTGRAMTLIKGENVFDAIAIGMHKTRYFILQVYTMLDRMIFSRTVGVENMSGPLGIVALGGEVARTSLPKFLFFLGMLSANLAVINFLPLPIVDGGLMVFLIIEKIKGSPVSLRVQVATQMLGLVLIIGTFLFVTFNDVVRLVG